MRPLLRGPIRAVLALLIAVAVAAPARANLLVNPSFEAGTDPGSFTLLPAGSTAITGWTVTRAGVKYVGTYWAHDHGSRSLSLNNANAGGVSQAFESIPGATYTVSFRMSGEPFNLPYVKQMRIGAAGQTADFAFDVEHSWPWDMQWASHAWSFTANAANTTLEFYSLMTGTDGPAIDSLNLVLTAAPVDVPPGTGATALALAPPAPNPAREDGTIRFTLDRDTDVDLAIHDVAGRRVLTIASGRLAAGPHARAWRLPGASPGLYFVTLRTPEHTRVRRLTLLR